MSVVVFGSVNMDLVVRTPQLPTPGQTLIGRDFTTVPGGKGANQAVACARLGVPTRMVGRVGGDVFGSALQASLADNGVHTEGVRVQPGSASGVALIQVDDQAENTIIVVAGANEQIDSSDIERLDTALDAARVLLLQLEVPLEQVLVAAQHARQRGVTVVLDPAPAQALPAALYATTDILTPNETEAAALVGFPVANAEDAARAAQVLLGKGVKQVIIKMSSKGVFWADASGAQMQPGFVVQAVDTVAAGDAFNGALAAALSQGLPFAEAVRWGLAGGALSVTQPGAQDAMPDRAALLGMLETGAV